jgi:hypothetical protein
MVVPVVVSVIVPAVVRPGSWDKSEVTQSLLQQHDKPRYLPLPIFRGRTLIRFGCIPVGPCVLHVIVGLAHLPFGFALLALGFRDVVHHIRDSIVQFIQHVRRTLRNDNSVPDVGRRSAVSQSCIVRTVLSGGVFFGTMLVRAVLSRGMFLGMAVVGATRVRAMLPRGMFFRAPVPACLRKLQYA